MVICSDHGTAYGEDGYTGHRLAHPVVWDVPYAGIHPPQRANMTATALHPVLSGTPYLGYVYAYPHKTAYRSFDPPRPLADVWSAEPRSGLFLYAHVPFCTMRCGFCNLFTTANPRNTLPSHYLSALRRQAEAVRSAMPNARFARFAIGGGTPTYLDEGGLDDLLDVAERVMGVALRSIPLGSRPHRTP